MRAATILVVAAPLLLALRPAMDPVVVAVGAVEAGLGRGLVAADADALAAPRPPLLATGGQGSGTRPGLPFATSSDHGTGHSADFLFGTEFGTRVLQGAHLSSAVHADLALKASCSSNSLCSSVFLGVKWRFEGNHLCS